MNELIKQRLDKLIELYNEIASDFKWDGSLIRNFAALTYMLNKRDFKKDRIESIRKYIKKNTGMFSYYRGTQMYLLSYLLTSQFDNPEEKFDKMMKHHDKMRGAGFKNSLYLPIANYSLLITCEEEFVNARISKAMDIFEEMKKNHPWLTNGDDYPLAVLLANSDKTVHSSIQNIEECYKLLNENGFSKGNGLQFLSHILSFSDENNKVKTERCKEIYEKLKENKFRVYPSYYGALGFLTLLGDDSNTAVNQVMEIANYFKTDKKFKWLGKGTHILIASAIVSDVYIESKKEQKDLIQTSLGISIEALIAAQTAACVAGACAASAAAASS